VRRPQQVTPLARDGRGGRHPTPGSSGAAARLRDGGAGGRARALGDLVRLERAADAVRLEEEHCVVVHHGRDLLHAVALAQPRAGHAAPAAVLRAPATALRRAPRQRKATSWRFLACILLHGYAYTL